MKRLRLALDRLQAQHPRLRARLIWDASGQHYLVPCLRKECLLLFVFYAF